MGRMSDTTMHIERTVVDRRLPKARDATTNDPLVLRGVNGLGGLARRYRDLMLSYGASLGGLDNLSQADLAFLREVVSKTLLSESMAGEQARGERVDAEQSIRIANTLTKLLRQLSRRAKELEPQPPSAAAPTASSAAIDAFEDAEQKRRLRELSTEAFNILDIHASAALKGAPQKAAEPTLAREAREAPTAGDSPVLALPCVEAAP
jgi:hypothetical protein